MVQIVASINKVDSFKKPLGVNHSLTIPVQAGDFLLVKGYGFYDFCIYIGQALRFRGEKRRYCRYTHAAMFLNSQGDIIESDAKGVEISNVRKYRRYDFTVVRIRADEEERRNMIRFTEACLHQSYGWMTIVSIGLSLLTGLKFSFGFDGQEICSGLVARALERSTAIFPRDASHITPADLASLYEIM